MNIKETGAHYLGNGKCRFTVWAPEHTSVKLHLEGHHTRHIDMEQDSNGYFVAEVDNISPGARYKYHVDDGSPTPDPSSHFQPEGVHGASEVVDHEAYDWLDAGWKGIPLREMVISEIHIGTFTPEGTFISAINRLDDLADAGINAVEIMPVAQFPGSRNWGYDGAFPYAVQHSYGGPKAMKKFVDACHARGIAVILDVVYNHLGPEGNYLGSYAPFFTDKYRTPWGQAINFDGAHSDGVRAYFWYNALYWFRHFHVDGLRMDAIHEMYDYGAMHFWEVLNAMVRDEAEHAGRHMYVIAESDLNNPKIVKCADAGGYGFDGQWLDDFHHALFTLLDKKNKKRYADFGRIDQLAKAYTDGFVHSGEYVQFRKRRFGASTAGISGDHFVVFNQNHDQVGNTVDGARLSAHISFDLLKLAMAALMVAPYVPMLFMGEEYGETVPFPYFVSHSEEELIRAVKEGRKREFGGNSWDVEPPDPQSEETFRTAVLDWDKRGTGRHKVMLDWTRQLIKLRRTLPALKNFRKNDIRIYILGDECIAIHRRCAMQEDQLLAILNFSSDSLNYTLPILADEWVKVADSVEFTGSEKVTRAGYPVAICPGHEVRIPPCSAGIYVGGTRGNCGGKSA